MSERADILSESGYNKEKVSGPARQQCSPPWSVERKESWVKLSIPLMREAMRLFDDDYHLQSQESQQESNQFKGSMLSQSSEQLSS